MRKLCLTSASSLVSYAVAAKAPLPSDISCLSTQVRPRERQIVEKILTGLTSKEIARQLGISPLTVRKHRQNVMARLGAHTTAELLSIAMACGIVGTASE
jgi:DNA-binding CsgD family transcriptional regulator